MSGGFIVCDALLGNVRLQHSEPIDLRCAQYPDGRFELQMAVKWEGPFDRGVTWKPVPIVQVDAQGEEII